MIGDQSCLAVYRYRFGGATQCLKLLLQGHGAEQVAAGRKQVGTADNRTGDGRKSGRFGRPPISVPNPALVDYFLCKGPARWDP